MTNRANARLVGVFIFCRRSGIPILVDVLILVGIPILVDVPCELTLDKYRYLKQCY